MKKEFGMRKVERDCQCHSHEKKPQVSVSKIMKLFTKRPKSNTKNIQIQV